MKMRFKILKKFHLGPLIFLWVVSFNMIQTLNTILATNYRIVKYYDKEMNEKIMNQALQLNLPA